MKVLKFGIAKEWTKEYLCTAKGNDGGGCGASLLVGKSDLFQTKNCDYLGDCNYFITFQCSVCKALTDVSAPFRAEDLPTKSAWDKQQTT